jgi:hypothetical protein
MDIKVSIIKQVKAARYKPYGLCRDETEDKF